MANDRWDLEDADDGGLDHEPGDLRLNEALRRAPKAQRFFQRPAQPPEEIALAVFDRGEYAGRSPFDIGALDEKGQKIRDGVPDKYLEKIVTVAEGGNAKSPPPDMDPNLYAACVSALAFRRGGREVVVSQNGHPAYNPWGPAPQAPQWQPPQPPPQWGPPQGYPPPQNGGLLAPNGRGFPQQAPEAVRMPCGHLTSSLSAGPGRPSCQDCNALEALKARLADLVGDKVEVVMQAVREWEYDLRERAHV